MHGRRMRSLLAASLLAWCPLVMADDPLPQALPPDKEAAAVRAAEATGLALFRHDRAAAVATDVALAKRGIKRDRRVAGWITEERDGGIVVSFVDATPAILHRVQVSAEGVPGEVESLAEPAAPSDYEAGAAVARAAALAAPIQPCRKTYNTVVLPAGEGAPGWTAYLLPATTKHGEVPIGGTYRIDVREGRVVAQRGFTRSCIVLGFDLEKSGAMMVTHLLDPVPTEAHVFWSLWAKTPMIVMTPPEGSIWTIEHGAIRVVERDSAAD